MRIKALRSYGLVILLATLSCLSDVSGQEAKAPAPESLNSLRARAEKGDASAQFKLGFMYDVGKGVPQDHTEAVRWYRKAADQGDADAQANLGSHVPPWQRGAAGPRRGCSLVTQRSRTGGR